MAAPTEHRTFVYATGRGVRAGKGKTIGWHASCDCGWTADGVRGGMTKGMAVARDHRLDARAQTRLARPGGPSGRAPGMR